MDSCWIAKGQTFRFSTSFESLKYLSVFKQKRKTTNTCQFIDAVKSIFRIYCTDMTIIRKNMGGGCQRPPSLRFFSLFLWEKTERKLWIIPWLLRHFYWPLQRKCSETRARDAFVLKQVFSFDLLQGVANHPPLNRPETHVKWWYLNM